MGEGVGACIEVVIVTRLVDAHAPQDDRRMVPVPADHAAHVVHCQVLPRCISDVLPAGNLLQHEQAQLIASVEKMAGLRVVRGAYDVALQLLAQDLRIAALHALRHGGTGEWKGLMTVQPPKLDDLAIELKAALREVRASKAEAALILIDDLPRAQ